MPIAREPLLALFVVFLAAFIFSPVHAQQSTQFFPAPTNQEAAAPSLWQRAGGMVVRAEARFSRELNRQMAAIRNGTGSLPLLSATLAAFLYGVFHTLAVGHGKTVVVGYFLGNRARPVQGVAMASWIAISHVVGAIVVAVMAHWLLDRTLLTPIEQNHWIRLVSFGAIALIGGGMLLGALRGHHHHHHDHEHHHGAGQRGLLAIAAGFVPCSGAILILTFAIANGILASGLAMVAAIAVGMAATLAGLGLASMVLRHQVVLRLAKQGGFSRWIGLLGPLLIFLIGALLFAAELSILSATANN
jgi:nickel/cobalt transporter (NicO) family protein